MTHTPDNRPTTPWLLGVDTGGTFTDFVLFDGRALRTCKVLSTPAAPDDAIGEGIRALGLEQRLAEGGLRLVHGTTIATNAALQGQGARTAFITNQGFADLLTIGRQARPALYQLEVPPPEAPVPADRCLEIDARLDAGGQVLAEPGAEELARLAESVANTGAEAVAVCLLHSFRDARHERQVAAALPEDLFVSVSADVLSRSGEYERAIATWLNARLGPLVAGYLQRLEARCRPSALAIMQSDGLTVPATAAPQRAVRLLLSGPAGGVAAARLVAHECAHPRLLTFDMGGTSTDVAAVHGGSQLTSEGRIGDYPLAVPALDIHTIGAGGGSLARVDAGGILHVGPASAGADPGPACYGRGGKRATVTDANVVLGRLPAGRPLGDRLPLDAAAARRALDALGRDLGQDAVQAALGVVRLANEHMAAALRQVSVARGLDPADFALCCFGGAGGLHVCELADLLRIRTILVPPHAGIFSALGMLAAAPGRSRTLTREWRLDDIDPVLVETGYAQLEAEARQELLNDGAVAEELSSRRTAELRYAGQSFTLTLPWAGCGQTREDFHQVHQEAYGHAFPGQPVELVHLGIQVDAVAGIDRLPDCPDRESPADGQPPTAVKIVGIGADVPLFERAALRPGQQLTGPMLVREQTTITLVMPEWSLLVHENGTLCLER